MNLEEVKAPPEQNQKLLAKKKYFRSGKKIPKLCLETFLKSQISLLKKINDQLDIKLRQFTEEELGAVLWKK